MQQIIRIRLIALALGATLVRPKEEEVLYSSGRAGQTAVTFSVSPILSPKAQGVLGSLSW